METCETHVAYRLALIHSIGVQTGNLNSKLLPKTYQMHHPAQERHFPTPLRHAEKQPLYWNWAQLSSQSSLL